MTQTIIDRINKLLALGNSEGATEAESELALQKAAELMLAHNIDQASLKKESDFAQLAVDTSQDRWRLFLACAVCRLYTVQLVQHSAHIGFVGRMDSMVAAARTYSYLMDQIKREYQAFKPEKMEKSYRQKFRKTFRLGAARRIWFRCDEIMKEIETRGIKGSTALVVLSHQKQELSRIEEYATGELSMKKSDRAVSLDVKITDGSLIGDIAGRRIQINREVTNKTS